MDTRRADCRIRIRRAGAGFAAEGPQFYVWAPDRGEVEHLARELAQGTYGLTPAQPTVMIRQPQRRIAVREGKRHTGSTDSEPLDA